MFAVMGMVLPVVSMYPAPSRSSLACTFLWISSPVLREANTT